MDELPKMLNERSQTTKYQILYKSIYMKCLEKDKLTEKESRSMFKGSGIGICKDYRWA